MTTLNDLTDVTISAPQEGQRLVYENGEWINKTVAAVPWVRPADWLAIPELEMTDEKFVGLMAITDDDANFAAILARGAYTVDWGDGTVTNHADNTVAEHLYDYNDPALDGTESSRGYKQTIVTVTPQSGQSLTLISLNAKHTQAGLQAYETGWLDIEISSPNFTSITIGGPAETVRKRWLERARLVNIGSVTNMFAMFQSCSSLQSVPLFNTSSVTAMNSMFLNCFSLQSVPLFDTSDVTNMFAMFQGCSSLQSVPLFNTSSVTNMFAMFQSCASLQSVPLFDTSDVTTMSSMFLNCSSIQSVPALDVSAVTSAANFTNMFQNCNSLSKMQATGFNHSFSLANAKLSGPSLDAIYTALPTVTDQTITVTGNWGTATHDPTIATAKGWTVTA